MVKLKSYEIVKHADIINKLNLLKITILNPHFIDKYSGKEVEEYTNIDFIINNIDEIEITKSKVNNNGFYECPVFQNKRILGCDECVFDLINVTSNCNWCIINNLNAMSDDPKELESLYEEAIKAIKFLIKYREEFIQDND